MSRGLAALLFLVLGSGCDPVDGGEDNALPPVQWPAGTVLAVDEVTIRGEDVAPWADAIGELYPEYTRIHCRRLALTNIVLPRAAIRDAFTADREEERLRCEEAHAAIDERAAEAHAMEATWRTLGLELWGFTRQLPPGTWSEPTELLGRWVIVRLEGIAPGRVPSEDELSLQWLEFPYLDPSTAGSEVQVEIDRSRLVVVDPEWNDAIPEDWKRRMNVERD